MDKFGLWLSAVVFAAVGFAANDFTAYSMVTRDGRRLVSEKAGAKTVFRLVATNELPASVPMPRRWTIYGIKSAHSDIGIHRSDYVQRKGTVRRLEIARSLFETDRRADDDPSAFRYVQEGWWGWFNFVADRGEDAARELLPWIRRGRLDVGASLCGNTTHVFGYEEVFRSLYPLRDLRTKWGIRTRTAPIVDNPGASCAIIDPFVETGIEYLTLWINAWAPTEWSLKRGRWAGDSCMRFEEGTDHPCVFWWESPSGKRLLVWSGTHYCGGEQFGLHTAFMDRLSSPNPESTRPPPADWRPDLDEMERVTAQTLSALEARVPYDVWLFPDYRDDEIPSMRLADACAAWNAKWSIPVFRTVGSLDEPFDRLKTRFSTAIPVIRGDLSCAWDRLLPAAAGPLAAKLAVDRLLPQAEALCTIAAVRTGADYPAEDFAHAYEALLLNDDHSYGFSGYSGRRCFDTWAQHHDWIETALHAAKGHSSGMDANMDGADARENRWYRIRVNAKGEIESIYDKDLKRELLDAPANRLLYTHDGYRSWSDPSSLGKVSSRVLLDPNEKRIVIENKIENAAELWRNTMFTHYGHYAFPFKMDNPRFISQLNGPVIDAHADIAPQMSDCYSCIRDWCAVENGTFGVALVQPDTFVMEYGELHKTNVFCRLGRPANAHLYSMAFMDGLHYQYSSSPSFVFRYIITSYAGSWRDAHMPAFATRQLRTHADEIAQWVTSDSSHAELVVLKAAEDGRGVIARFRETEGRAGAVKLVQRLYDSATIVLCDPIETDLRPLKDGVFNLEPYGSATIRIVSPDAAPIRRRPATEPWTGLLTRPRAFAGGNPGQIYLLWQTDASPDFAYYEIERDGALLATAKNIVDEGVLYRNARYEDKSPCPGAVHRYRIRSVYHDGRKGPFTPPFAGRSRSK